MSFFSELKRNIDYFKEDSKVYWNKRGADSLFTSILYAITCHGWHIMFLFRLGKIIYAIPIPVLSHVLKIIYRIVWFIFYTLYGIEINPANEIGKGFYIGHNGTIHVRGDFGDYCSISQGVTVGEKGAGLSNGWPSFGSNVYIGSGAKVFGPLKIGSDVTIGANAVVTKDIPDGAIAMGIPAKIKLST